jgi:hypothetical protein
MTRVERRELLSAALTHLEAAAKLLEEAEEQVLADEARMGVFGERGFPSPRAQLWPISPGKCGQADHEQDARPATARVPPPAR